MGGETTRLSDVCASVCDQQLCSEETVSKFT